MQTTLATTETNNTDSPISITITTNRKSFPDNGVVSSLNVGTGGGGKRNVGVYDVDGFEIV